MANPRRLDRGLKKTEEMSVHSRWRDLDTEVNLADLGEFLCLA
jgi:hypothetical protein